MIPEDYNKNEKESLEAGRTLDQIGKDVVDCLFRVHFTMGPGLAEEVYEECMCKELTRRGIPFTCQERINIEYDGEPLETYYIADLVVEGRVIIELKAVKELLPVHEAQLINYLKLTSVKLGYLVNFHVAKIKDGIKRRVNNFPD
jgi:GxxExxY protein